jgi:hypothetical protein
MSAIADRSYTTLYAQRRGRIQALQFNAARYRNQTTGAPILPQTGVTAGNADSDRASRALGQRRIWREVNPTLCVGTLPNDIATGGSRAGLTYSVNPPSANPLEEGCCPV